MRRSSSVGKRSRALVARPRRGAPGAAYAVRYVSADQRGEVPPLGDAHLVLQVRINGLEYARLYARP